MGSGGVGEWRSGGVEEILICSFPPSPSLPTPGALCRGKSPPHWLLSPSLFPSVLAKHPTPSEKEWVAA